ncbi:MAG: phosphotransferase [Pseudomonadales bacterium]|nr:phosphotransferase [Pseudomonadales bacterium]
MTEELRVSAKETEIFLVAKFGKNVSSVQSLGEGAWSYAFTFVVKGVKNVIRWGNVPDNFQRDAFAHTFNSDLLPVPPIKDIGQENNRYYAISPFVVGNFLESLSPNDLEIASQSVIEIFRALRAIDMSTSTGFGFWNKDGKAIYDSWKAFLLDDRNESEGSLNHGWREILEASDMGMDSYNELWRKFQNLIDHCPEVRGVVHSDFVNRNVLVDKGKISAVLDWGSAFFGDPLYEIAWIKFCEPWFPASKDIHLVQRLIEDFKTDPNSNTANIEQRLLCYQLRIGADAIAYNAFRKDWKTAQFIADYSAEL